MRLYRATVAGDGLIYANYRHTAPDHICELLALVFTAAIVVTGYAQVHTIGIVGVSTPAARNACCIRLTGEVPPVCFHTLRSRVRMQIVVCHQSKRERKLYVEPVMPQLKTVSD